MRDDGRQLAVLAAIGIDVYRLRCAPAATAVAAPVLQPSLVVACARGERAQASAHRLAQILRAIGAREEATAWLETAPDGPPPALPDAPAYLMIGSAIARVCSAQLPLQRQDSATIVIVADIGDIGRGVTARRALWQALKPLARRLRAAAD